MDRKKYTIKDIAQLAGVSKGTVDRVLHKRGKVSPEAEEKVASVMLNIDYHPNPMARNLKTNKVYQICVLLPNPQLDHYWIPALEGIKQAAKEFKSFGIAVQEYYYQPYDQSSFLENYNEILTIVPDAILMATANRSESIRILGQCEKKGIVLAFFNNYIEAQKNQIFIGQDLYHSGRIAAQLIEKLVENNDKIGIVHFNKEPHMQLKEDGFRSFFGERAKAIKIISKNFETDNGPNMLSQVKSFFDEENDITAFFITNSKAHVFVDALPEKRIVVGYDLLERNIQLLKEGKIDYLIHQNPKRQAYLGVGFLADHFLFGKSLPEQKLLPIDIITSENVKYYIDRV